MEAIVVVVVVKSNYQICLLRVGEVSLTWEYVVYKVWRKKDVWGSPLYPPGDAPLEIQNWWVGALSLYIVQLWPLSSPRRSSPKCTCIPGFLPVVWNDTFNWFQWSPAEIKLEQRTALCKKFNTKLLAKFLQIQHLPSQKSFSEETYSVK